jgi:hypothetical protein
MRYRCKTMMQIIGLTSRGLIKGARVTDRRTDWSVPFFNTKHPKLWQPWHPIQDLHDFSSIHMCWVLPIHLKPKYLGLSLIRAMRLPWVSWDTIFYTPHLSTCSKVCYYFCNSLLLKANDHQPNHDASSLFMYALTTGYAHELGWYPW